MTKHQRLAELEQPSQPPCRVAELAQRFGVAEREWNILDNIPDRASKDAEALNEMMMRALVDAAAFDRSTSPLGALFQLLIVSQEADALYDHGREDMAEVVREHAIRLDSALWGVRRFLEAHFGISADAIGGGYLMVERVSYAGRLAAALADANKPAPGPRLHVAS